MHQLWGLFRADVVGSIGAAKEADTIARAAIDFRCLGPLADHYLGTYCRWCARIAAGTDEREAARAYLNHLHRDLGALDPLDQAEILIGSRLLTSGDQGAELDAELQQRLASLPPGVGTLFERLELLSRTPSIAIRYKPRACEPTEDLAASRVT
jgi:hypothetical protein